MYITPKETEGKTAKEVRKDLTKLIKPKNQKIRVVAVQEKRTEAVRMVVDSDADVQKLKSHPQLVGYKV